MAAAAKEKSRVDPTTQEICNQDEPNNESYKQHPTCISEDHGRKITFDNLDYKRVVHYMTEQDQNEDKHCVTVMSTENRVHGINLSDEIPTDGIFDMVNGLCIPSTAENKEQKANYAILVERILVQYIPCFECLSDAPVAHIPHEYRREMMNKTETVSL